jgi:hypothetical protein
METSRPSLQQQSSRWSVMRTRAELGTAAAMGSSLTSGSPRPVASTQTLRCERVADLACVGDRSSKPVELRHHQRVAAQIAASAWARPGRSRLVPVSPRSRQIRSSSTLRSSRAARCAARSWLSVGAPCVSDTNCSHELNVRIATDSATDHRTPLLRHSPGRVVVLRYRRPRAFVRRSLTGHRPVIEGRYERTDLPMCGWRLIVHDRSY